MDRGCGVPGVDPPVIDGLGDCPGVRGREPRRVPGGGRRCDSLSWSWTGTPRPRCLRGWGCYPSPPQSPSPPSLVAAVTASSAEEVAEHLAAGHGAADHHGLLPERGPVVAARHGVAGDGGVG